MTATELAPGGTGRAGAPPPPRRGPARRRAAWAGLGVAVIAGPGLAAYLLHTPSDLDGFRWPMAELALHGHPLLVYSVHSGAWRSDNGPLTLVPLGLVVAVVNALGWQDRVALRDAVATAAFGLFTVLLAWEGARAVAAGRGDALRRPVLAALVLLLAPALWIGTVGYGHLELVIELWLSLLAVRLLGRGRALLAGVCLGLAILTRTTVVLTAIPLVLLPLSRRRLRPGLTIAGTTAAVVAAGWAPFLVADPRDVIASLIGYRSGIPPLGGSLWFLVSGTAGSAAAQSWDFVIIGVVALGLTALALRRRRGVASSPDLLALLALSGACLPLLAKTVWPYYLTDPTFFAGIWWLARPGGARSWRAVVPLLLSMSAILLAAQPPSAGGEHASVAAAASAGVLGAMALLLADWFARSGSRTGAGTAEPAAGAHA